MEAKTVFRSLAVLAVLILAFAPVAWAAGAPSGIYRGTLPVARFDISPPLRDIPPLRPVVGQEPEREIREGMEGEDLDKQFGPQDVDSSVQSWVGSGEIPAPSLSFDGPANLSSVAPPDPDGDVGPNHYVAMSNLSFQIFNKTGTSLYGPALNNTLWAGFGGDCQTDNSGDPIVLYDQISDRWMLSQFTVDRPDLLQLRRALDHSRPDRHLLPLGLHHRHQLPRLPQVRLLVATRSTSARASSPAVSGPFVGVGAYADPAPDLIAGNPTPTVISFVVTPAAAGALQPRRWPAARRRRWPRLPPAGTPNFYVGRWTTAATYGAPAGRADRSGSSRPTSPSPPTRPSSSPTRSRSRPTTPSLTRAAAAAPASRSRARPTRSTSCPIASGHSTVLAYRNFGDHEAIVTNQSVEAGAGMAGIRWWEIRAPTARRCSTRRAPMPRHRRRDPPLDGLDRHGQRRQHGARLQRLERDYDVSERLVHRPPGRRPAEHHAAGRRRHPQRHRLADRRELALGRLHLHERRPGRTTAPSGTSTNGCPARAPSAGGCASAPSSFTSAARRTSASE